MYITKIWLIGKEDRPIEIITKEDPALSPNPNVEFVLLPDVFKGDYTFRWSQVSYYNVCKVDIK